MRYLIPFRLLCSKSDGEKCQVQRGQMQESRYVFGEVSKAEKLGTWFNYSILAEDYLGHVVTE